MAKRKKRMNRDEICQIVGRATMLVARGMNEGAYDRIAAPRAADATLDQMEDFMKKHCDPKKRVW
jgi:hypothetical protein